MDFNPNQDTRIRVSSLDPLSRKMSFTPNGLKMAQLSRHE